MLMLLRRRMIDLELLFIEGVSGAGKSTMTRLLADELMLRGLRVRAYLESDAENPIDFYSTAYLPLPEYEKLCTKYPSFHLWEQAIHAGAARLIRYGSKNAPLYPEPLLSELAQREFCYNPCHLIAMSEYTAAYEHVWRNFSSSLDETFDYILFDGSLLHHPINDLIRNYSASSDQSFAHVHTLLNALGKQKRRIFYLESDDIATRLAEARHARGQAAPSEDIVHFWEKRYEYDSYVLNQLHENSTVLNISHNGWEQARKAIFSLLNLA